MVSIATRPIGTRGKSKFEFYYDHDVGCIDWFWPTYLSILSKFWIIVSFQPFKWNLVKFWISLIEDELLIMNYIHRSPVRYCVINDVWHWRRGTRYYCKRCWVVESLFLKTMINKFPLQAICFSIFKILRNKKKTSLKRKIINKTVKGCHIPIIFENIQRRCWWILCPMTRDPIPASLNTYLKARWIQLL